MNSSEVDSLWTKNRVGDTQAIRDRQPSMAANGWSILTIVAWAAVLSLPCIIVGIPGYRDAYTHTMSQFYFSRQFWSGEFYPRWLAGANKGYGSPMFFFQYPFPYYVTALMRPMLGFEPNSAREGRELGVFCFLALAGSGLSGWFWFSNRCKAVASVIGALVYMSLPYLLGQTLYARSAIGELSAFIWMPLILAFCDRAQSARSQYFALIAISFALLILSNVMYATMFMPVIAVYAVAASRWNRATLFGVTLALIGGVGIAGIYVVPLVQFKHFLDLGAMARYHPGFELGVNFLYFSKSDVQSEFLALISLTWSGLLTLLTGYYIWRLQRGLVRVILLAVMGLGLLLFIPELGPKLIEASHMDVSGDGNGAYALKMLITSVLTLSVALLAYCRITSSNGDPRDHAIVVVACSAFVLMLPWSAWLWRAFPGAAAIQFPWRLCSILSVAAAYLFAISLNDWLNAGPQVRGAPPLAAMLILTVATLVGGGVIWRLDQAFRFPISTQVDAERWVEINFPTFVYPPAVRSFAAHLGTSPDNYDVAPTPIESGVEGRCVKGSGSVSVTRLYPRRLAVSARCEEDASIRVGQAYFPLWKIIPATRSRPPLTLQSSPDGLIEVSSSSGRDEFELVFDGGFAEKTGIVVSAVSIVVTLTGFVLAVFRGTRSASCSPV